MKKMSTTKRLLSWLLCIAMLLSLMPITALAETGNGSDGQTAEEVTGASTGISSTYLNGNTTAQEELFDATRTKNCLMQPEPTSVTRRSTR